MNPTKYNFSLLILLVVTTLFSSYKPAKKFEEEKTMLSMLHNFPVESLDEMIENLSEDEFAQVLMDGHSTNWELTFHDEKTGRLIIKNKHSPDNRVMFVKYSTSFEDKSLVSVQQQNAQVEKTDFWIYNHTLPKDKKWELFQMPLLATTDFLSENILLPEELALNLKPYLSISLEKEIYLYLNSYLYLKEVSNYFHLSAEQFKYNFIKYRFQLTPDLKLKKNITEDYKEILTQEATIIEELDNEGPGITNFDCPHGVSVTASSELTSQGSNNYRPKNILDTDDKTAWSEGVKGSGIGEWIEFTIKENYRIGDSYQIKTGYTKDPTSWVNNNRVKKLKCVVNGKAIGFIILNDSDQYQMFNITPVWFKNKIEFKKGDKIRFVIEEVYKGKKFDDTLISYFVPTGNCG